MNKFQRFFNIKKIDEEQQMVYGYASTADLDSDGEVIKIDALKKALPNYMQFPTIREMHQHKAVGTTKEASVDDVGMYIGAKIVTDDAWKLVKEGVYKAFSIGGNVLKRVGNAIHELELVEISLVDVPANKKAVIELWKSGKVTKNAEMVYSLSNLMIQIKDMIYMCEYMGKDSKKLSKMLEIIKSMIAETAAEPEPSDESGVMMGKFANAFSEMILQIDFGENEVAKQLAKEVSNNMKKEEKVEEKKEEVVPETTVTPTEETPEKKEEVVTPAPETPATPEQPATPEEKGEDAPTLQKLQEIQSSLDSVIKSTSDNAEIHKETVSALSKMADAIKGVAEKVAQLEKVAVPAKSKSTVVFKSTEEDPANKKDPAKLSLSEKSVARKAEIEKELKELDTKFNELGANQFAQQGYSMQASKLHAELEELVRQSV